MRRPAGGTVFAAALLVLAATFGALTAGFERAARGLPAAVSGVLCALLTVQLVRETARPREAPAPAPTAEPHESRAIQWVLLLGGMILLGGIWLGPAVFVVAYLRGPGAESWLRAMSGGAVAGLFIWLVTTQLLGEPPSFGLLR